MAFKNTPYAGTVRTVIYETGGIWYGAALEFNIIETGDSPQEVMILLDEAMQGYIETAQKNKFSSVLNQEVDHLHNLLWNAGQDAGELPPDEYTVYNAGSQLVPAIA